MRAAPALPALVIALWAASADAQELRLTPAEIAARPQLGAGAGSSGVAGVQTRVLYGDPNRAGLYVVEIRAPPNTRIEAHTHRDERVATVIAGTWYFGYGPHADEKLTKPLPPGSVYTEPKDVPHFALTKGEAVTAYITGVGPTDTRYPGEVGARR